MSAVYAIPKLARVRSFAAQDPLLYPDAALRALDLCLPCTSRRATMTYDDPTGSDYR